MDTHSPTTTCIPPSGRASTDKDKAGPKFYRGNGSGLSSRGCDRLVGLDPASSAWFLPSSPPIVTPFPALGLSFLFRLSWGSSPFGLAVLYSPPYFWPASSRQLSLPQHLLLPRPWKSTVHPEFICISIQVSLWSPARLPSWTWGSLRKGRSWLLCMLHPSYSMCSERVCWSKSISSKDILPWNIYLHKDGVAAAVPIPTGGEFGGSESTRWEPADPLENEWCSFISSSCIPDHGTSEMLPGQTRNLSAPLQGFSTWGTL